MSYARGMDNHAYYRSQYEHCVEQSGYATDTQLKADWLKLAMDWLALIPLDARNGSDVHAAEHLSDAMTALGPSPPAGGT
jgi:hypothetical protein